MTNKEALNYLAKILGLDNYPNGTEEDLTKDDYAFTCLYQLNEELNELEEYRKIMSTPIQDIMKRLKALEILKKHLKEDRYYGLIFLDKRDLSDEKIILLNEVLINEKNNR
jgi:hypothetical protein